MYSSMKFGKKIPQYDAFTEKFFVDRLQREVISQNQVNLEKHLKPFTKFGEEIEENARKTREMEEKWAKEATERRINEQKTKAQNMHLFNQEYETEGVDSWKKNMLRKKENQNKEYDFQLKEAQKYKDMVDKAIFKSEYEVMDQIDKFEKRRLMYAENELQVVGFQSNCSILSSQPRNS